MCETTIKNSSLQKNNIQYVHEYNPTYLLFSILHFLQHKILQKIFLKKLYKIFLFFQKAAVFRNL